MCLDFELDIIYIWRKTHAVRRSANQGLADMFILQTFDVFMLLSVPHSLNDMLVNEKTNWKICVGKLSLFNLRYNPSRCLEALTDNMKKLS